MSLFGILGGIGSVLGGLGGLFNKPKNVSSGQNLMSLAQGARDASAATGFNPLTLLQAGSGTTGFTTGGTPPLASVELITGGLQGLDDQVSGDAARRRAADTLNLDLARLRYEQARSGVVVAPLSQADAFPTLSPLGAKSVQVYAADGQTFGGGNASARLSSGKAAAGNAGGSPQDLAGNDLTSLSVGGVVVKPHEGWSDADFIEQRYGDFASWIYGVRTAVADASKNMTILADDGSDDQRKWSSLKHKQTYGEVPSGFNSAGQPYWSRGGVITYTPPNKMKGY